MVYFDNFYSSRPSNDSNSDDLSSINAADQVKTIRMRAFINKIEKNFIEKDNITQNIRYCDEDYFSFSVKIELILKKRQEILNCKQRIDQLENKRDKVYQELEKAQQENNM